MDPVALDEEALIGVLDRLLVRPLLAGEDGLRLSLAGASTSRRVGCAHRGLGHVGGWGASRARFGCRCNCATRGDGGASGRAVCVDRLMDAMGRSYVWPHR